MSRYEEYIQRLCRLGDRTPEQAKKLALSREVEKYYQKDNSDKKEDPNSTHTPLGECR